MSFIQKRIRVILTKSQGTFTGSGSNTLTLSNLRVSAKILKAGGRAMGTAQISIFGMTLSQMNDLSTLGIRVNVTQRNLVTILAGELGGAFSIVFAGTIQNAYADFSGAPEVAFRIMAQTGQAEATIAAAVSSYPSAVSAATVMGNLAAQAELSFVNNGVTTVLRSPYYYGSARDQMVACAKEGGFNQLIDNGTLFIWPYGSSRGGQIPKISAETGMVGYPQYTAYGLMVRTLFDPNLGIGGQIQIESILTPACGTWNVFSLDYELESRVPGGQWFADVGCYNPKLPAPTNQ